MKSMHTLSTLALTLFLLLAGALHFGGQNRLAAAPSLPPRPTLTPTPLVTARIILQADDYRGGWSAVQWQGNDGAWHDVESWQGRLETGVQSWRVLPKDFGTGPFRWIVSDGPDGKLLAHSAPFALPTGGQILLVPVQPAAPASQP